MTRHGDESLRPRGFLGTRILERLGLVATAYDVRARLRHIEDRPMRARNARFRLEGAPDGLPLPPPALVYVVAGHFDLVEYYETSRFHADLIREGLDSNGVELASVRSLLGCGCGRVIRKGSSRIDVLGEQERARFQRGELVVTHTRYAGRNLCAAFHPASYVRERLAGRLRVLDFVPASADGGQSQDVFVLQRPAQL